MDTFRLIAHYFSRLFCCCCTCCRKRRIQSNDLQGIAEHMRKARNVIVMTGAGISTNAGIPDFRSKSFGLYERLEKYDLPHPTAVFTVSFFRENPEPFYEIAHAMFPVLDNAKPTKAHYFIKLLDTKGILLRHYTQNIDALEELTGLKEEKTVQAHGHLKSGTCLSCNAKFSFEYMKNFVIRKEVAKCDKCSGVIKPDVVLFGEALPNRFWKSLVDFPNCDLLIIMGTSLVVQPFAGLANKVDYNTPRLLINRDEVGDPNMLGSAFTSLLGLNPDFGSRANSHRDVFYQGDCDQGCMELARLLGWEQDMLDLMGNS